MYRALEGHLAVQLVVVPSLSACVQHTCEIVEASRDNMEALANVLALTIHIAIKW